MQKWDWNKKTIDYIWQITIPIGIFSIDVWLFSSEVPTSVDSRGLGTVMVTVFNVPPTNKITIFQALQIRGVTPLADYHPYTSIWTYAFVWHSIFSILFSKLYTKSFFYDNNDVCLE